MNDMIITNPKTVANIISNNNLVFNIGIDNPKKTAADANEADVN